MNLLGACLSTYDSHNTACLLGSTVRHGTAVYPRDVLVQLGDWDCVKRQQTASSNGAQHHCTLLAGTRSTSHKQYSGRAASARDLIGYYKSITLRRIKSNVITQADFGGFVKTSIDVTFTIFLWPRNSIGVSVHSQRSHRCGVLCF